MNREQMIAWLTLEGWEPNGQNEHWWVGCNRDGLDVFYDEELARVCTIRIDSPKNRPVCSWDMLPASRVKALYLYISKEKDHGKLE